jgi:hypothetical protein
VNPDPHPLVSVSVADLPPWLINSPDGIANLDRFLSTYPGAAGHDSYVRAGYPPDAEPDFRRHQDGWGELYMNWRLPDGPGGKTEKMAFLRSRTRLSGGQMYFFPAYGAGRRTFHPLMAWWVVLFNLSMLARYEPATWFEHINVDSSPHAVPLERLLRQAITRVPHLVAETIIEVAREKLEPLERWIKFDYAPSSAWGKTHTCRANPPPERWPSE